MFIHPLTVSRNTLWSFYLSSCKRLPIARSSKGKVCLLELLESHPFLYLIFTRNSEFFSYAVCLPSEAHALSGFVMKPSDFLFTSLNCNSMCQTLFLCRSNYWLPALVFPWAVSRKWHELTWIAKYCFHKVFGSKILITAAPSIHLIFRALREFSVYIMRYFLASWCNTHWWFWNT